jgi:dienelactone hydrolase
MDLEAGFETHGCEVRPILYPDGGWTMRFASAVLIALLTFSGCGTARHEVDVAGNVGASAGAAAGGLLHIPVRENGVVGTLVLPDTGRRYPGVLRIGGAEGGIQLSDAETIASNGYAVFAIAYFGIEDLPADLEGIPLEYFGKAIEWMKGSSNISSTRFGVVGISRGSTLALLLPTIYDDFDAVVAIAPSHVTWQSSYLDWDRYAVRSSYSYRGQDLPFVPYDFSDEAANEACNAEAAACTKMYEQSLSQGERVADALIPVEKIRAPVLLLSGKADSMWPASAMGDLVVQRLSQAKHPFEHRHVIFEDAGHCSINRCYDSVALDGDRRAIEGMRRELLDFLGRHLGSSEEGRP